jgi:hypothetical protein
MFTAGGLLWLNLAGYRNAPSDSPYYHGYLLIAAPDGSWKSNPTEVYTGWPIDAIGYSFQTYIKAEDMTIKQTDDFYEKIKATDKMWNYKLLGLFIDIVVAAASLALVAIACEWPICRKDRLKQLKLEAKP